MHGKLFSAVLAVIEIVEHSTQHLSQSFGRLNGSCSENSFCSIFGWVNTHLNVYALISKRSTFSEGHTVNLYSLEHLLLDAACYCYQLQIICIHFRILNDLLLNVVDRLS